MVLWDDRTSTQDSGIVGIVVLVGLKRNWVFIFLSFALLRVKLTFNVQVENITWASWSLKFSDVYAFAILPEMGVN